MLLSIKTKAKSVAFLTGILILLGNIAFSQTSLDSIFYRLKNEDVFIFPIFPAIRITGPNKAYANLNKDSLRIHRRMCIVSSLDEDIVQLAERYTKQIVVEKLFNLLNDTARDFYANVLLYDLLDNQKTIKYSSMTRKTWISSGKKEQDYIFWANYLKKTEYL